MKIFRLLFLSLILLISHASFPQSNEKNDGNGKNYKFELEQNYPNPFNPSTSIKFTLPKSGHVRIIVYNTLGQEVKTLINSFKEAGTYTIEFNADNLNTGLYFYKLETEGFTQVKKMTLLK